MSKFKGIKQFIMYSIIGGSNFLIDLGILNVLWHITGIYAGFMNYIFKFISFCAYSANGYFWNRHFTFKPDNSDPKANSYFKYATVLGTAMLVNAFILSVMTMHNIFNINPKLWANISALTGSIVTGIASFLVNKFFIFEKKTK